MATSKRAWQKHEQWWAELHGENRTGNQGHNTPDCTWEHTPIGFETKLQTRRCLKSEDIAQAKRNAKRFGMPWALVLHTKNQNHINDDLVVLPMSTYLALAAGKLTFDLPAETHELAQELLDECLNQPE